MQEKAINLPSAYQYKNKLLKKGQYKDGKMGTSFSKHKNQIYKKEDRVLANLPAVYKYMISRRHSVLDDVHKVKEVIISVRDSHVWPGCEVVLFHGALILVLHMNKLLLNLLWTK